MKNIVLSIIMLFLFSHGTRADEYTSDKWQWEKCNFTELNTPKASEIKKTSGRNSLHEYLITRCGYRPVQKNKGYSFVALPDCKVLFNHASKGECHKSEYSEYLGLFLLELDPKVFEEKSYQEACEQYEKSSESERNKYNAFRKKACPAKLL